MPEAPPPEAPEQDERRTRPFADVLREIDKGRVHAELSDRLQDLLAAVMDVRKPGTLQLTIKVDAAKADGMVEVSATVAAKQPRRAKTSFFYVTDDHNVVRDNPHQPPLPLTGLPGGAEGSPVTSTARSAR